MTVILSVIGPTLGIGMFTHVPSVFTGDPSFTLTQNLASMLTGEAPMFSLITAPIISDWKAHLTVPPKYGRPHPALDAGGVPFRGDP